MAIEQFDTALFLNFGADTWWQFKDANSGAVVRVDCNALSPNLFQLKQTGGTNPSEHILQSNPIDVIGLPTLQYTWLQSTTGGQTAHWGNGLILPNPWRTGDSVSETSRELNPATGGALRFTLKLDKATIFKPPKGSPIRGPLDAIVISQTITDIKLATVLAKGTTIFGLGAGMLDTQGQSFGNFFVLRLENWSGARKER